MNKLLEISGKGELSVQPDIIIISFHVNGNSIHYAKAIDELNEKVETLRNVAENHGIERKNLKTRNFRVRKNTQNKQGKVEFLGYVASHDLELRLSIDKERTNQLLNAVAKETGDIEFHISFGLSDRTQYRKRLVELAVADAKEMAEHIAKSSGVTLSGIENIRYTTDRPSGRSNQQKFAVRMAESALPDLEAADMKLSEEIHLSWIIK